MAGNVVESLGLDAPTDAELIAAVRAGDTAAYGALFDRHREAANRLARQLVRGPDADDLVAESFTRVLVTLQQGKGPDESFRAYLLTAMRRFHIDRIRQGARVRSTDDEQELDRTVEWTDPAEMRFESGAAAQAFGSLPERWQAVLWHLDVEGNKPADVAPVLGMSPNSVSALAYRAREGLRQAYLQQHLGIEQRAACRGTTDKLGAHVRDGLSARDRAKVEAHLDECARCMGLYLELREVNSNLAAWLAPALLGAAATGYLAAGSAAAAATTGGALVLVKGGLSAALTPIRALGPAGGTAAAGVATAAVVATTVAVTNAGPSTDPTSADRAAGDPSVSAPAATDPTPSPEPSDEVTEEPAEELPEDELPEEALPEAPVEEVVPEQTQPPTARPSARPTRPRPTVKPPRPRPTTPPVAGPTPTRPTPTAGDGLLDLDVLGLHLGTLGGGQLLTIGLTHSSRPAVVVLRYDEPVSLINTVSPGWTCYQQRTVVRCVADRPKVPLELVVKASGRPLISLGS